LYQTRKLDLPGIGSFTLDPGAVIPQESDRMGQQPASGISFKNANIFTPDDELITYIKEHTGKMKSLAAADLDFYLTTGRQLLNIGKPFFIEGIGTLLKNKDGRLDFTPGDYLIPRIAEPTGTERSRNTYDEPPRDEPKANNVRQRQTLLLVLLVAAVVVVGWGGYYLYQRNNFSEQAGPENRATVLPDTPAAKRADTTAATRPSTDTATAKNAANTAATLTKVDSVKAETAAAKPAVTPAATPPPVVAHDPVIAHDPVPTEGQSLFHFVILRTPNKVHALRRYTQLLGYRLNIKMETKDSSFFKLYFPIAAAPRDTTHIKDSIADVYAANVVIEK
jgi:hypothetical protein